MSSSDSLQSGYTGCVDVAFRGDVAVLTMRCGENRFNNHFMRSVNAALDAVLGNKDIKALITTGNRDSKFYSNGLDLNWLTHLLGKGDFQPVSAFRNDLLALSERMATFPLPTICALNGHAYAMGAVFSMAHDYRIMVSERGWWSLNEVHINLRFSPWIMGLLKEKMGGGYLVNEALVLGPKYTAQEAKVKGIVQEVSPTADLIQNAMAFAKRMVPKGGYDRDHMGVMKKDVYGPMFKLPIAHPDDPLQSQL